MTNEVWYRYEDRRYSIPDEYGDHAYTKTEITLLKYPVVKRTPKGAWLTVGFSSRWVSLHTVKRFACPTLEEAAESFVARKTRQVQIHQARADKARGVLKDAEAILAKLKGQHK
jgi:hypothetical protein